MDGNKVRLFSIRPFQANHRGTGERRVLLAQPDRNQSISILTFFLKKKSSEDFRDDILIKPLP